MAENKVKGFLVRSVKQKSKECIVLEKGTDYEVIIHYNGYDKKNRNGMFALKSVGNEAHFYQFTNKMKKDPECEQHWYELSLKVSPNKGFLNRVIRVNTGENSEHFVVNRGTDYECHIYFNGLKSESYGLVAIRRIGSKSTALHINKKMLEES